MNMSAAQPALFDAPLLAGLRQVDDIVTPDEEQRLSEMINKVELSPFRFHGWLGKRLTASFGWRYDFDDARLQSADPIPDWLLPIREKSALMVGLKPYDFAQSLLVRYDPGAGIGWHRDRPVFEHVIGISLGASTTMRFRRRRAGGFDRASVPLAPRSLYHLTDDVRWKWEHSIQPMDVTRWSITFRSLSQKSARLGSRRSVR